MILQLLARLLNNMKQQSNNPTVEVQKGLPVPAVPPQLANPTQPSTPPPSLPAGDPSTGHCVPAQPPPTTPPPSQ